MCEDMERGEGARNIQLAPSHRPEVSRPYLVFIGDGSVCDNGAMVSFEDIALSRQDIPLCLAL